MAQPKTVQKWERDLSVVLTKVFSEDGKRVVEVKCPVCEEFSSRINSIAGYSEAWVNGTTSVKLDGLKKGERMSVRIGQEGCSLADFKAEDALDYWFNQKVRCLNLAKSHNYPAKRSLASTSSQIIDIAGATPVRFGGRRRGERTI